jgi:1-aminocyclopropane-1-carboxylate deaminase/D-cysteine desulfhydrase-like pyridoxal-dependent ACC family enzyme
MQHSARRPAFDDVLRRTEAAPPLALVQGPTPLEHRVDLSADLGIRLFLKREDRTDDLGCGHKRRKLSYVMADALRQRADVLVTSGSLPSNQCKAIAALAPRWGLRAHLVFGGDDQQRPQVARGSYLLTTLCAPTISWHERSPWVSIGLHLEEAASQERRSGGRPYVIGSGASQWPGLLGSLELGFEMAAQLDAQGVDDCHLVAVAGSGGTCLGLALAAALLAKPWKVSGICIGEPASEVAAHARVLLADFEMRMGQSFPLQGILDFTDIARGEGYDRPRAAELEAVALAVRRYGLLLDRNYMVKAFLGLRALLDTGQLVSGTAVLVHSGGQLGIFDESDAWVRWHRDTCGASSLATIEMTKNARSAGPRQGS